jgi:hypothetical protein
MRVTLRLEDLRPPPEGWVWAKIVEERRPCSSPAGAEAFLDRNLDKPESPRADSNR